MKKAVNYVVDQSSEDEDEDDVVGSRRGRTAKRRKTSVDSDDGDDDDVFVVETEAEDDVVNPGRPCPAETIRLSLADFIKMTLLSKMSQKRLHQRRKERDLLQDS